MGNPFIKTGEKMKKWLGKIIKRDFGKVSFSVGLYNILWAYEKYVPLRVKRRIRKNTLGRKRLRWN